MQCIIVILQLAYTMPWSCALTALLESIDLYIFKAHFEMFIYHASIVLQLFIMAAYLTQAQLNTSNTQYVPSFITHSICLSQDNKIPSPYTRTIRWSVIIIILLTECKNNTWEYAQRSLKNKINKSKTHASFSFYLVHQCAGLCDSFFFCFFRNQYSHVLICLYFL